MVFITSCSNVLKKMSEEIFDWRDMFKDHIKKYTSQGLYLRGIRLREGYSQKKLGKLIGVNQNNISAMENGKRSIGKEMAKRLAEILRQKAGKPTGSAVG